MEEASGDVGAHSASASHPVQRWRAPSAGIPEPSGRLLGIHILSGDIEMRVCSLRNFTIMQASLFVAEQTLWLLFYNDVSYVAVYAGGDNVTDARGRKQATIQQNWRRYTMAGSSRNATFTGV